MERPRRSPRVVIQKTRGGSPAAATSSDVGRGRATTAKIPKPRKANGIGSGVNPAEVAEFVGAPRLHPGRERGTFSAGVDDPREGPSLAPGMRGTHSGPSDQTAPSLPAI